MVDLSNEERDTEFQNVATESDTVNITGGGQGDAEAVRALQREAAKKTEGAMEVEEEERELETYQWLYYVGKCMNDENPSHENIKTWMDMVIAEMSKTNFLNSTGFVEEENDFTGILDEETQDYIVAQGEGDNEKALHYVLKMKNEVISKMEELEMQSLHDEKMDGLDQNMEDGGGAASDQNASKTHCDPERADEDSGADARVPAGQANP